MVSWRSQAIHLFSKYHYKEQSDVEDDLGSAQTLDIDEPPKRKIQNTRYIKKLMVCVWWSGTAVIHYDFINLHSNQSRLLLQPTQPNNEKTKKNQPTLVNRSSPILLLDNTKSHKAEMRLIELQKLELE